MKNMQGKSISRNVKSRVANITTDVFAILLALLVISCAATALSVQASEPSTSHESPAHGFIQACADSEIEFQADFTQAVLYESG